MGTSYAEIIDTILKMKKEEQEKLVNSEPSMHSFYGVRIGVLLELLERIETLY